MMDKVSRTEVPLPNEVPAPAYISKDPATDELLKQNQDLMARLTVSLRRAGELELQIRKYEEKILTLKRQNQSISEASLLNREISIQKEQEAADLRRKLEATEIDYAKLYALHKNDIDAYDNEKTELRHTIAKLETYKTKVEENIKPYLKSLISKIGQLQNDLEDSEQKRNLLQSAVDQHQQHLQEQQKKHENKLATVQSEWKIRMDHMEEIFSLEQEKNQKLENTVSKLQSRLQLLQNIDDEYTLAKNRAIAAERSRFELERKFEEQLRKMQQSILELRDKNQSLELENKILKQKAEDRVNFLDFSHSSHVEQ